MAKKQLSGDQQTILDMLHRGRKVQAYMPGDGRISSVQISEWWFPVNANSLKALLRTGKVKIRENSTESSEWKSFELAEEGKYD